MISQLIAAFLGSLGFALFFKMKGRQVFLAAVGGAVTWGVYLIAYSYLESYFVSNLIAAVFVAIFAEIMARLNKAPTTIFLTAAAVPLIPGGSLYYTMFGLVSEDKDLFVQSGTTAIVIALAIAFGFVIVAVLNKYISRAISIRK
ncbi:MAG: threonine/serine exporter family protein [Anaerovoracaceae bacterium]